MGKYNLELKKKTGFSCDSGFENKFKLIEIDF